MTKSFFNFLCLYIFFIIAFGLGFYVSLNTYVITSNDISKKDPGSKEDSKASSVIKPSKTNTAGEDYKFFNTSWQALVKTSTMFSGEFVSPRISLYNEFRDETIKILIYF